MKNNTIIFGDSYSTFEHYIPAGHKTYYPKKEHPELDVTQVSECWWHQVVEKANLNLILNDSWSGSTIGYTGFDQADSSDFSFIARLHQLIENDFFEKNEIHKVFVFGGTNDSWADAPLGEPTYSDWKHDNFFFVLPAICYFLYRLRETLPQAEIYCLINTELKSEISDCMEKACRRYSITPVTFDHIDKKCGHPTVQGMKMIANSVLQVLHSQSYALHE